MADAQLPLGEVKAELFRTNETFRQLVSEHQDLGAEISRLSTQSFPSDQEQFEEAALKKKKLLLKDRIEAMVRGQSGVRLVQAGQS